MYRCLGNINIENCTVFTLYALHSGVLLYECQFMGMGGFEVRDAWIGRLWPVSEFIV